MRWKDKLIEQIKIELQNEKAWSESFTGKNGREKANLHLAIFSEPFLALLCKGEKRIESRFSVNRISPYKKIKPGDIVAIKSSGGPVIGFFCAGDVMFYQDLNSRQTENIEVMYGQEICTHYDPLFWSRREKANYGTLIRVEKLKMVDPFKIHKKDRSAWSILS